MLNVARIGGEVEVRPGLPELPKRLVHVTQCLPDDGAEITIIESQHRRWSEAQIGIDNKIAYGDAVRHHGCQLVLRAQASPKAIGVEIYLDFPNYGQMRRRAVRYAVAIRIMNARPFPVGQPIRIGTTIDVSIESIDK